MTPYLSLKLLLVVVTVASSSFSLATRAAAWKADKASLCVVDKIILLLLEEVEEGPR